MHDVIIIGGGPAGLTAALYARRNGLTALVLEKATFGGQMTHSPRIENYPGIPSLSGNELAERMLDQALAQGAEIELENAVGVTNLGDRKRVTTDMGTAYDGRAVILATGVRHRMTGLPGEEDLVGSGISFCAVCDGDFYQGRDVCVLGGGNSALQEALLLAGTCRHVTILQDLPALTGEKQLIDLLTAKPNVDIRLNERLTGLNSRDGLLTGVTVEQNGVKSEVRCDGLFVAIGLIPDNGAFSSLCDLDAQGYFDSDERCLTRTPGVFTAGDCRRKTVRQITTAAADGAAAALAAVRYVQSLRH